ncbi:MAG: TRAP transporter large permease [Casimicrobiaceae bacterium]
MSAGSVGLLYGALTLILLFSGMPIAFALGASALTFMAIYMPPANLWTVAETMYAELDNFTLLTIPLFVLMGAAIGKTRAGADVYGSLNAWLYKVPGGLGLANVFACSVFAAMCGSSPATASAIGSSGIPQLIKRGYSEGLAAGLIAAGGTLGILIPPSLTLILYGLASEQSIGRLFMAGIGPGIMLTLLFAAYVVLKFQAELRAARRAGSSRAPGAPTVAAAAILEREHYTWKDRLESLPRFLPFIVLIVVIMGAMYGGWATPSEVAGIGAAGALLLVMTLYKCWRLGDIKAILSGTVRESTMLMMIIATSFLFTYVMSYLGITQAAAQWLVSLGLGKWQFFVWIDVLLVLLGFFLPPVAIILMVTPIILPALKALGIDLIWFGIIMTILMEMGLIHPPVGLNLFVIQGIAPQIKLRDIIWGTMPFIGLMVLGIVVLCLVPEIATWLPSHVYEGR